MSRTISFNQLLTQQTDAHGHLCVGLDPDPSRIGSITSMLNWRPSFADYCTFVVEAVADSAVAIKVNVAFFERHGPDGMAELVDTVGNARAIASDLVLILDCKRGDIGNSSAAYADAMFNAFDADAVTISPYMGGESIAPFLERADRGAFILCRTSNPGSDVFQMYPPEDPLYLRVALRAHQDWNHSDNVGLVVGATYPTELSYAAAAAPGLPMLVPGIGAQGGDMASTISALRQARCFLINSSRAIMYPEGDFVSRAELSAAISRQAKATADAIVQARLLLR